MVKYVTRRIRAKLRAIAHSAIAEASAANQLRLDALAANQERVVAELDRVVAKLEGARGTLTRLQYQTTLAPDGLPIPPPEFHAIVSGTDGLDAGMFLNIGESCCNGIRRILAKNGIKLEQFRAILDFGCGCGRIIRNFRDLEGPRLFGTDYNPKLANWCRSNLPFAEFGVNGLAPPLKYEDGSFDFIYAFSVFTHLSEKLQTEWLAELNRVMSPGGYLLFTTMGEPYAEFYLNESDREDFRRGKMIFSENGTPGEGYYNVYHPTGYVQERLMKGFELADFVPGRVMDVSRRHIAQDSHLLRKTG